MISQYNRQFNSVYAIWQLTINQLLEGTSDTSYVLYTMMIIVCCPVSGPYQYPATELNISALKCKFWRVCSLRNSWGRPRSAQWVNFSWLILTLLALFNIINNKPAKSIRLIFSPIQINWWIFTVRAAVPRLISKFKFEPKGSEISSSWRRVRVNYEPSSTLIETISPNSKHCSCNICAIIFSFLSKMPRKGKGWTLFW